jgi:hypothetical protein
MVRVQSLVLSSIVALDSSQGSPLYITAPLALMERTIIMNKCNRRNYSTAKLNTLKFSLRETFVTSLYMQNYGFDCNITVD